MDRVLVFFMLLCAMGYGNPIKDRFLDMLTYDRASNISQDISQFEDLQPVVEGFMKRLTQEVYPLLEEILFDPEIPTECGDAFQKILRGMQSFEFWAYRFLRSSGGIPSALDGASADLGDYDSCLAAEAKDSNGDVLFTGRYCTLFLTIDNIFVKKILDGAFTTYREVSDYLGNDTSATGDFARLMSNRIGVCVPSTCRGVDIEYAIKKLGGKYGFLPWVPACRALSEDPPLSAFQIFVIVSVVLLVILSIAGIFAEQKLQLTKGRKANAVSRFIWNFLHAFSLKRNLGVVFRTGVPPDIKHLGCIHGIRTISAFYILYGHTYLVSDPTAQENPMHIFRWLRNDISMVPIYMGFYVVDTFFCVAGIMIHRSLKLEFMKDKPAPPALIAIVSLIRRWVRLSIPAVFLIALYVVYPILLSGPGKDLTLSFFVNNCVENWWSVPAMVGNFFGVRQCILHLWYIPADFQATAIVLFPAILLVRRKYRRTGTFLLAAVALFSCLFIAVNTWIYELPPFVILLPHFVRKVPYLLFGLYNNSLSHLMSSVIGIFIGHLIDRQRTGNPKKYSTSTLWKIWVSITVVSVINFFLPFYWQTGGDFMNVWGALYAGFSRVFWCSFLGWLIFACATGHGGLVDKILTSRVFIPLSRISYSFYLVHVLVMGAKVYHQRNLTEARHYLQAVTTVGDFALSFFFSVIFFCLVEAPTTHLEKMVYLRICKYFEKSQRQGSTIPSKQEQLKTSVMIENYRL